MTSRFRNVVVLACAALLVAGLSACGGSSKKSSSSKPTSTTASASPERAEAEAAATPWHTELAKVKRAFARYGSDEPAHVRQHNLLGERRDAYNLRNGVYRFDLAVRKIKFPASMQTDVNALLDGTKKLVATLDKMSSSSKVADINRYIRASNAINLSPLARTIDQDLSRLSGVPIANQPSSSGAGSSDTTKLADALLRFKAKTGAKASTDALCAAKLMIKKLSKADLQTIESGNIPRTGPLSNEIGAALLACQA
jgi:hypothetical protein